KDNLAIARCTELLELPTAAFHLLIVLLNFGTFFVMTHDPRGVELPVCRDPDDMVGPPPPAAPAARPQPPVLSVPCGAGWRPVAPGASGTPWWGARQGGGREASAPPRGA